MRLSAILLVAFCSIMTTTYAQNVGIGNTSPNSKVDVSGDLALREGTPITVTAGANTLTLPTAKNSVYRLTGASGAFSITSISAGNDGMLLTLINASGQVMTVSNGSIQTNTGADLVGSTTTSTVNLIYNATIGKWIVASGEGFIQTSTSTNIYNSDGTLTGNRTVSMGNDNLTFNSSSGNLIFNPSGGYGYVGIGTTAPLSLLANTATNILGSDGQGVAASSLIWAINANGYAAAFYNAQSALPSNGLAVQIAGTSANNRILDLSTSATQGSTGTTVMAVFGNGNVGIGTSSPAHALDIATGSGQYTTAFSILPSTYSGGSKRAALELDNWYILQDIVGNGTKDFSIYQGSTGSHIININTSGQVGINTTSQTNALQVSGKTSTTNFQMTNGGTSGYVLQSDASGNATWVNPISLSSSYWTLAGPYLYNNSGTNVGIGTTSPYGVFDVETGNSAFHVYNFSGSGGTVLSAELHSQSTNGAHLRFTNSGSSYYDIGQTNNDFSISDNNGKYPIYILNSNANVGIGTTTPASTLTVNGTTSTTNFQMTTGATNGYILKSDASGNASWVNPTSITTGTTNTSTWTQSGGLTSTVNSVPANVSPASGTITNVLGYNSSGAPVYQAISGLAESVSNTVSGNNISTTVDGTTGTAVTVPNIYTSDGTIAATRTVTMGNNNLIFNTSGTGNVVVGTGDGGGAPAGGILRGPNAGSGNTTAGGSLTLNAGYGYNGGAGGSVFVNGGTTSGSGTNGNVYIRGGYTSPNQGAVYLNDNNGGTTFLNDAGGTVNIGRTTAGTGELNVLNGLTIDNAAANNGTISYSNGTTTGNSITFGSSSGEGIASNRSSSANGNQYGVDLYTNFTRRLSVTNGGYVGINNTVPSNTLNVGATTNMGSGIDIGIPNDQYGNNGSSYAIRFYGYRDVTNYIITAKIAAQRTYQCCAGSGSTPWLEQGSDLVFSTTNAPATAGSAGAPADNTTERMRIKDNGNIGIGTSSPGYPLDIGTTVTASLSGSYGYLAQSGAGTGGSGTGNQAISVHAAGRMFALEYDAQSDRRIKTGLSHPDAASMLDQVNKLKVTDYSYIDKVERGDQPKRGFIAQEVEEVIPTAVHKNTDVIPSVFASAEKVSVANSTLTVTTAVAHGFAEGDEVLLYDKANKAYHVKVGLVLDERTFEVYDWTAQTDQIFVYGKKVNDFRAVDFDQITALAIGAVQELDKKVEMLEKDKQALQSKNEKLERALKALQSDKADASQVEQLKAEVEILKEIVGAKAQK